MKNTQKKKISRSYHLLTKVESGKCRRVTAAIDVIVTLCRKSVGKRVCNILRAKTVFRASLHTNKRNSSTIKTREEEDEEEEGIQQNCGGGGIQ